MREWKKEIPTPNDSKSFIQLCLGKLDVFRDANYSRRKETIGSRRDARLART
jgi:hypothetical protein